MLTPTKRFTLDEYHRLADLGFFAQDDRVELVRGEIIPMVAKGTADTSCCSNLLRELAKLVGNQATLRCQDPITLDSGSEPEPDFVIAHPRDDRFLSAHPTPDDILLVIEIADSSLSYDREVKVPLYAEANISDYWLFNLVEHHLEAYSEPYQLEGKYGYAVRRIVLPTQVFPLPCFSDAILDLNQIFPG